MVPRPVTNVVCPGRAISVERDVLGPLREQAPCYAMGHAAGLAAVQVVREGLAFREVDADALREALLADGAIVAFAADAAPRRPRARPRVSPRLRPRRGAPLRGGAGRRAQGRGADSVRRKGLTERVGNVRVTP